MLTCKKCGEAIAMSGIHRCPGYQKPTPDPLRAALVAIQELAAGFQDWNPMDSRDAGEVYAASSVEDLLDDIRRVADDALGGDNNG